MNNEIRIRTTAADICGLFEDLLETHNIQIPSEDRTGDESEACIYGDKYYELENAVSEILAELCDEVKANPNALIVTDEY